MEDVQARVAAQVAKVKPGEWVLGDGWDEGKLAERRHITAADLDAVAPEQPGVARQHHRPLRRGQHYALKIAEIAQGHARPAGRHHRARAPTAIPTAWCSKSAQGLITRHVPPFTRDQQKAGHGEDDPGLQRRGHDRRQGPRHQRAEMDALQRAAEGREARRAGVRAVGRAAPPRPGRRRAGARERQPAAARSRSATACCSRAA